MYLSRLILNARHRAVQRDLADCQHLHRTVMALFPQVEGPDPRAALAVLYRLDESPQTAKPILLVQARVAPDFTRLEAGYLAEDLDGRENPTCKPVDEQYGRIAQGARLAFRLRANPTRKVDTKSGPGGERRNGRRVVLDGDDEQLTWLKRKAETNGFALVAASVRPGAPGGSQEGRRPTGEGDDAKRRITFGAVLFEGELRVTERDKFLAALVDGIGPAKAYGFGLLSVAPAGR